MVGILHGAHQIEGAMIQAKIYRSMGGNQVVLFGHNTAIISVRLEGAVGVYLQCFVSQEDLPLLEKSFWRACEDGSTFYAVTGHSNLTRMSHVVLGKPIAGMVCDHVNRNGLDNRRRNLRHVTRSQNKINRGGKPYKGSATGVLGVYRRANGKFRATVRRDWKLYHIGTFSTAEEARLAVEEYKLKLGEAK